MTDKRKINKQDVAKLLKEWSKESIINYDRLIPLCHRSDKKC